MPPPNRPTQHPHRVMLHNEIHARPPEALTAPLAIAHIVMLADAAGREASRAHVAALLRDHHLALPDAQTTHLRMDLGVFRIRWELHTEFVSWTFMVSTPVEAFGERDPTSAIDVVPREWLAALPGQCLCSLNLWVLPPSSLARGRWSGMCCTRTRSWLPQWPTGMASCTPTLPSMPMVSRAWCCWPAA